MPLHLESRFNLNAKLFVCTALLCAISPMHAADLLDLTPSARISVWQNGVRSMLFGAQTQFSAGQVELDWDEERDIQEVDVRIAPGKSGIESVEYWFKNWPYDAPQMPSMEDPVDDPWQGVWLKAEIDEKCEKQECHLTFKALREAENKRAHYLPGTVYRRTLKLRITGRNGSLLESVRTFSNTIEEHVRLSIQPAALEKQGTSLSGWISVYNGKITSIRPVGFVKSDSFRQSTNQFSFLTRSNKSFDVEVIAAKPQLPGSNDDTVVTWHAVRKSDSKDLTFSFKVADLERGPILMPALGARVTGPHAAFQMPAKQTIRERIRREPEQTIERARKEIPALDAVQREWGGPLYMPLAADSSWQKFAFELGGNIYLSKDGLKAKPDEKQRMNWPGDRLTWRIFTGAEASKPIDQTPTLKPAQGFLPIAEQRWTKDNFAWSEEAFATPLRGPLSPQDPGHSEKTPAALLLRVTVENQSQLHRNAVFWMAPDSDGPLRVSGHRVFSGEVLRATLDGFGELTRLPNTEQLAVRLSSDLAPGEKHSFVFKLPALTDLSSEEVDQLDALDYDSQKDRVTKYWSELIEKGARFSVPEPAFDTFLRSTIAHIHITATKDPATGLVFLPAASYIYDVYENESCYQLLLLDTLGQHSEAANALDAMLTLQGSKNFPGAHEGSYAGVFHGVRTSDTVDYTANGYGLDHGTVLWTLGQHYLYTRDREWFAKSWPHMRKAIDWIESQRATTKRIENGSSVSEYGLLPASKLEDNNDWANWFSINAFAWAGMDLSARALAELKYPEARAVRQAADNYRRDLREAVLRATRRAPVVRLQNGTYQPYVPTVSGRRFRLFGPAQMNYYARYGDSTLKPLLRLGADRDTLCGTVLLLILGVFEPNEPIADWILNDWEDNETLSSGMGMNIHGMTDDRFWFSQGGMVFQANLINPIPVYLKRHEASAAIRNLYNDFVSCLYPDASQFTEEYHQWTHGSGPFYKSPDEARFVNRVRDTLVLEDGETLWLAPGAPRRWISSAAGIQVKNLATFFGPLSYTLHAGRRPKTVEAHVEIPQRNPAKKTWLVVRTPLHEIKTVQLNGKRWDRVDRSLEAVDLTGVESPADLSITY
jgi:hypothetical protein